MPRITWNDNPTQEPGKGATIYSFTDSEYYKDFFLARSRDNNLICITKDGESVPGLEGGFTKFIEAHAAIDHYLARSTIKDDVTIAPLS